MLEDCGVEKSHIDQAISLMLDKENKYGGVVGTDNLFFNTNKANIGIENFFTYMAELSSRYNNAEFKKFLEEIILSVDKNFCDLKTKSKGINTSYFYLLMRELYLRNPQDASIRCRMNEGTWYAGRLDYLLGGISLAQLQFAEEKSNIPTIVFDDFRTLPGLERLGIGSQMFVALSKKIVEEKPSYSIMACGVLKGKDGEMAYRSWGAYPIYPKSKDRCWEIVERPLTEQEYLKAPNFINFYFTKDVVKRNASFLSKTTKGNYIKEQ